MSSETRISERSQLEEGLDNEASTERKRPEREVLSTNGWRRLERSGAGDVM